MAGFYTPTAHPDADEAFQATVVGVIRSQWANHIRRYGYPPAEWGIELDAYWCNFRWRVFLRTDAALPPFVHKSRKARAVRAEILDAFRRWYDAERNKESINEAETPPESPHQAVG